MLDPDPNPVPEPDPVPLRQNVAAPAAPLPQKNMTNLFNSEKLECSE